MITQYGCATRETILGPLGLSCSMQAVYSPDETVIAACGSASYDVGCIKIWNASTGKPVANLEDPNGAVISLAWHGMERRSFLGHTMAKLGYGIQPLGSRLQF